MPVDLLLKRPLFERYLKETTFELSTYAFVAIFIWKDFFDFSFEEIDGRLCVFARSEVGTFLYLPPLGGEIRTPVLGKVFDRLSRENSGSGVSRIENMEESHKQALSDSEFVFYKRSDEYLYRRSDIVGLAGQPYKSKRNDYNCLKRQGSAQFLPYAEGMQADCLHLYDRWAQSRVGKQDDVYQAMIEENRVVHRMAIMHARMLGLVGRVVTLEGKIVAYSFGFALKENTFCILLEITDLSCKGLATYIFREFCADEALVRYDYINAMDDFGMDNIRETKMSFRPCRLVPAYAVSLKKGAV